MNHHYRQLSHIMSTGTGRAGYANFLRNLSPPTVAEARRFFAKFEGGTPPRLSCNQNTAAHLPHLMEIQRAYRLSKSRAAFRAFDQLSRVQAVLNDTRSNDRTYWPARRVLQLANNRLNGGKTETLP